MINSASTDREYWANLAFSIARKPLESLANGKLRANMPIECAPGQEKFRREVSHLEALGRSLAGIAPWLENSAELNTREAAQREQLLNWARAGLHHATNPDSPDFMNWTQGGQPLVDAAFVAHGLLRAPRFLWDSLEKDTQTRIIHCLKSTRVFKPCFNNWLLFSAIIEAFLFSVGEDGDVMRVDYALRQHEAWYCGDSAYSDGPNFHFDYYNSFVIQPMLLDILHAVSGMNDEWNAFQPLVRERAARHAIVQERLIAPDSTFPVLGRSICYRSGCFQLLAQSVLQEFLPAEVTHAQVRSALTAVWKKLFEAPGTFDSNGWLQIGLCGHQPKLGETYISTGSLYLCLTGFLPLGLAPSHPFWSGEAQPWSSQRLWDGENLPADHAAAATRWL